MSEALTEAEVATESAPVPPPRRRRRLAMALAVTVGTALIGWRATAYGHWLIDDAAITFAYARNVADGLGPVLQPGVAPVEGYSNPLWLGVLVVARLLGIFDHGTVFGVADYVLFPKLFAFACCAGILAAVHIAARRLFARPWIATIGAAVVLSAVPSFVI